MFTLIFNAIAVITFVSILIATSAVIEEKVKHDKLYRVDKKYMENKSKKIDVTKIKLIEKHRVMIENGMRDLGKENQTDYIFYLTLGILIAVSISMILVKQFLMAILAPLGIQWFISYILKLMGKNTIDDILITLPGGIDNVIRISSKFSDIKTILWEASLTTSEPLGTIFGDLSRKMMTSPPYTVLMDFADEYDNVWIYSFVLILVSYMEDSDQQDTIRNLKSLRDMLEQENLLTAKKVAEGKYGVVINYALVFLGFLGLLANVTVNPYGRTFFFETFGGLVCFVLGIGAMFFTIILNIKMSRAKS